MQGLIPNVCFRAKTLNIEIFIHNNLTLCEIRQGLIQNVCVCATFLKTEICTHNNLTLCKIRQGLILNVRGMERSQKTC